MKKSWSLIALAAALAASNAFAATPAGTDIVNQAEIVFTPEPTPNVPNPPETTTPSNPVTTTVLPVPSFTITPNDNNSNGPTTEPHYNVPGQTATVKPCDKNVAFKYVLTNTGNVANESYTLTNTKDPTGTVKEPDNIRFYAASADTNNDGILSPAEVAAAPASAQITKITGVPINGSVTFFQVYDIPCTATSTDKFGGDPTGTRDPQSDPKLNPGSTPSNPAGTPLPKDADNSNVVTIDRKDGVVVGPKDDANADNKTDPANTTPNPIYTQPSTPGDTTPDTVYPGGTTLPGTTITVPNDTQIIIGTCTAATSVVTFTNTVQNGGNRADTFNITQTNDFPAGSKVEILKADGSALLPDSNGDSIPDVQLAANGQTGDSASFLVRVTYTGCLTGTPSVVIKTTSTNDPTKSDTTKDQVNMPGLSFGDPTPTPGGDPTPIGTPPTGTPGNPSTPVDVTKCTGSGTLTYLPMEIANIGTAADLYNVTGTAPIKLTDGTTQTVPVVYYKDVNGNGVYDAGTDTALTDTNGDGKADTGLIAPGTEVKLIAVVTVPCSAMAQVIKLDQNAESPTTGVKVNDPNDTITVGTSPVAQPVKKILVNGQLVDTSSAKPGDTISYNIVGKNTSNGNVTKAMVCDKVPANTSYLTWSATSDAAGTILYSKDGGAWQSAPLSGVNNGTATAQGSNLCAAVDTNGDGTITTADVLAPGKSITATFTVKVN